MLRQPAALHLHMATLAAPVPGLADGHGGLRAPGALDAARYRESWAAYEKAPRGQEAARATTPALAAWQRRARRAACRCRHGHARERHAARAGARPTSSRSRSIAAGAPQARPLADLLKARKLPLLVSVNFDPPQRRRLLRRRRRRARSAARSRRPSRTRPRCTRRACRSRSSPATRPTSWPACARPIERGLPREAALRAVTLGAGGGAGRRRPHGQPGGGQDRERGGLVGRAARPRTRRRRWCSWTASSTSPRDARPAKRDAEQRRPDQPTRRAEDRPRDAQPLRRCRARPPPAPARRRAVRHHGRHHPDRGPQGTIEKGTVLDPRRQDRRRRAGRAACPPGTAGDRRHRPVRDARASSTPTRTPRSRAASTSARDVGHRRGARRRRDRPPRRRHLPPARRRRHRRSTCCTARATRSAARTRC